MAINWFPGHMHKARKEIKKVMPKMDLIIEVLDARIPFSSENPLVHALRDNTPCIKLLNKADLADPVVTDEWLNYLERERGVKAVAITQYKPVQIRALLKLFRQFSGVKVSPSRSLQAMILGIPNVGKSTLINILSGRIIAKTGNTPAVTKMQQRIKLPEQVVLYDTPGFLWPRLEPEACGYRLAATGAIRDSVLELEDIAHFAIEYLMQAYPQELASRFELEGQLESALEVMDAIGMRRGSLRRGGLGDLHKVAAIVLTELRGGMIGRVSLERPQMIGDQTAELT